MKNKERNYISTKFMVAIIILYSIVMAVPALAGEDYITTQRYDGMTYFIPSNGDGTFGAEQFIVDTGDSVYGLGSGDFDNDGDIDIVAAQGRNFGQQIVFIEKLGLGNDFAAPVAVGSHGASSYPMDFAVADYNNDGNLDFVFDDYYGIYYVFLGNGDGTFTSSTFNGPEYEFTAGKDAADFDGDGNMDFAVALEWSVNLYSGNGDGTFTMSTPLGSASYNVMLAAGDFDSDGIPDIITGSDYDSVYFYKGNGDGTFQAGVLRINTGVWQYAMDNYDFDLDGNQDLVILAQSTAVKYYKGNGDGTFNYISDTPSSAYTGLAAPPSGRMVGQPYAVIVPTEQTVNIGDPANLDGSGSHDDDGSIVSWDWNFGDGTTASGATTSHAYAAEGTNKAKLTVTDNSGRKDSAYAKIHAVGSAPIAEANGPYTGDVFNPVTFDGTGSSDAEGIVKYEWDFGDGTTGTGINPTHYYPTSGTHDVTLTVYDAADQSDSDTTTVTIENAIPVVVTVPWGDGTNPHTTWDGKEITLQGTVRDTDATTYEWNFGDGSATVSGAVTNPYIIEAKHTYTGSVGQLFTATLTVCDASSVCDSDEYYVKIHENNFESDVNVAIDDGLWNLHKNQNRYLADGVKYGSWGSNNKVAFVSAAVQAFENNQHVPDGNPLEDPYVETVDRGLNYILSKAYTNNLAAEYDSNSNGIGIGCNEGSPLYEIGMAMMAIVGSENKHRIAVSGPDGVIGREYQDIIRDMVDQLVWAQNDNGGWRYSPNYGSSDNSVTQWPVLGLEAAETQWGIAAPDSTKTALDGWLAYSQGASGGFGYADPNNWQNIAKTGAGIAGLYYAGHDMTDAKVTSALNFMDTTWDSDCEFICGNSYYGMYSAFKAATIPQPPLETIGSRDWYGSIGQYLLDHQNADGGWPNGYWTGPPLTTAWAIQILTKSVITKPPVAEAGGPYDSDIGYPVYFDGSGSYHQNAYKNIVQYEWDFDNNGVYDILSVSPGATYTYDAYGTYTVRLRVTDDSDPALTDTDTAQVDIHPPPHLPTAVAGGPYEGWVGVPLTLDGSGSYDPNDGTGSDIVSYEWDLDNDGLFDDATGMKPENTWPDELKGVIGLRVTDSTGGQDSDWTTVVIGNHAPVADAVPGAGDSYLGHLGTPVTFDGSDSFDVDECCGDAISFAWDLDGDRQFDDATGEVVQHTWDVEYTGDIGLRVTDSHGVSTDVWTTVKIEISSNNAPVADPNGPYSAPEGSSITFDGSASSDPDGDLLEYRWDFDNDGTFDTPWSSDPSASKTWYDNWIGVVTLEVRDSSLLQNSATSDVTVSNVAPTPSITLPAPGTLIAKGTEFTFEGTYTDPGTEDTHTAHWNFDSIGSTPVETSEVAVIGGTVSTKVIFNEPGIYKVKLTVTDDDSGVGEATMVDNQEAYVVVYDPDGGFVTGGGWIDSPAGAYTPDNPNDADVVGRANFGFISKYKKGVSLPIGQTEFQFQAGDLNFHSTSYEFLMVNNNGKAIFKGDGTINGYGTFKFQLTAIDAELHPSFDEDRFRIRIWEEVNGFEDVRYDNALGDDSEGATTTISGGAIVIHTK